MTFEFHSFNSCCTTSSPPLYLYAMKQVLLFGAGKSATVLIDYLKDTVAKKQWRLVVADANLEAALAKTGSNAHARAVGVDISDEPARQALIGDADVVISLLPPALHYLVATDCVRLGKPLLTASYVDDKIKALAADIKAKGILFLCEMGLDPGIDHMSAMQLIHRIQSEGGTIDSFYSHCGGLVAPESDTNPWHYKISWNPRNIVLAGKAGAVFKEQGEVKQVPYEQLFADCREVAVDGIGQLAFYPNRDSLSYIPVYGLENSASFVRTTLRHPDFCKGWHCIMQAELTDETKTIDTHGLSIASFLQHAFSAVKLSPDTPLLQEQFDFLGWNDDTPINRGECNMADALQFILEKKWKLENGDKDMIVMLHEIGYSKGTKQHKVQTELVVKGNDHLHTAMAKTVGLPLGIAATLLLEGTLVETGLHIPIIPSIYEPVLAGLQEHGIVFREREMM